MIPVYQNTVMLEKESRRHNPFLQEIESPVEEVKLTNGKH